MLRWLALFLPFLAVERLRRVDEERGPLALIVRRQNRDLVSACSQEALALGVRPGQTAAAAQAVAAGLRIERHDAAADRALQAELGRALLRYSPDVVLDGERGFLIEIGRTARHFGGEKATTRRIVERLRSFGFTAQAVVADRPATARALALVEHGPHHVETDGDDAALAPLPWTLLDVPRPTAETFRLLGLKTLGDLLRLPRAGAGARFGEAFTKTLEILAGEREETLERFRPTDPFSSSLEWWPPSEDLGRIAFAAKRLFDVLEDDLAARNEGLLAADLVLRVATTKEEVTLDLSPSRPTPQANLMLRLLQHRLEGRGLPGAVDKLRLVCHRTAPLVYEQTSLFDVRDEPVDERALDLCDRLSSRLGEDRVYTPGLVAEHRPERAFRTQRALAEAVGSTRSTAREGASPHTASILPPAGRRPLEMDATPLPIAVEADGEERPCALLEGRDAGLLRHVLGPERIASGWWDGRDADRRYFEVETKSGLRWWIFHERKSGGWFRHGVFA